MPHTHLIEQFYQGSFSESNCTVHYNAFKILPCPPFSSPQKVRQSSVQ